MNTKTSFIHNIFFIMLAAVTVFGIIYVFKVISDMGKNKKPESFGEWLERIFLGQKNPAEELPLEEVEEEDERLLNNKEIMETVLKYKIIKEYDSDFGHARVYENGMVFFDNGMIMKVDPKCI